MMDDCLSVIVPQNVSPGGQFQTVVNNNQRYELITVVCPADAAPGQQIYVKLSNNQPFVNTSSPQEDPKAPSNFRATPLTTRVPKLETYYWIIFDVIAFICYILSCSYGPFAKQEIDTNCGAIHPYTGAVLSQMYYHLYDGLSSSSSQCINSSKDFCIRWRNSAAWDTFNKLSFQTAHQVDTQSAWYASQVLLPFASIFAFAAVCLHIIGAFPHLLLTILRSSDYLHRRIINLDISQIDEKFKYLIRGGNCIVWSWVFGLIAMNIVAGCGSMTQLAWSQYFEGGYQISNLLDASTQPVSPAVNNCLISIQLSGGGIALSVALPVAFFVSFFVLIQACCLQKYVRKENRFPSVYNGDL